MKSGAASSAVRQRVGCEFLYSGDSATPAVFQVLPRSDGEHHIVAERLDLDPPVPSREYLDSFGNRCLRVEMPPPTFALRYDALVDTAREPDPHAIDAAQLPVDRLPDETLMFLMPSRYCEVDRLLGVAWDLFGETEPGWPRVQAVCDWVHTHLTFMHGAGPMQTALEAYLRRQGVCRDFAQLAVTFCRALNVPARYGFGYMGDIDVPPMDAAMDFHAWFEAYLGDGWYTFDARHNVPRVGRVFIGRGRDAVDVAMVTSFGSALLERMTVWADEVPETATLT
jgi:transglutaminase-like putative cysteine protease